MKKRFTFRWTILVTFIFVVILLISYLYEANASSLNKRISEIVQKCQISIDWRYCYGKELSAFNKTQSFKKTLAILSEIQDLDEKTRDCHFIAHQLASSEVEKNPKNWLSIFDYVDQNFCVNGFIHGALEGRARFDHGFELNTQTIPQTCQTIEERVIRKNEKADIKGKSNSEGGCSHILGHILLANQGGNISEAVKSCESLNEKLRSNCLNGVFMENITRDNLVEHQLAERIQINDKTATEFEQLCLGQKESVAKSCWREIAHLYTSLVSDVPLEVFKRCQSASIKTNANECYFHGINLMVLGRDVPEEHLTHMCQPFWGSKELPECINRTIGPLIQSSTKFIDRAITFCRNLPPNAQGGCFTQIASRLKNIVNLKEREDLCQKIPLNFRIKCQS
ncbi:hypothetical protein HYS92_03210 [Candidatus Daviesbacteria bacterium]|nr:hypothetical protein [Candidatus Daviesbacteria bacterium]